MNKEWTEDRVDALRRLFFNKWKSLNEDNRGWGDYLLKHNIFVMGPREVRASWNMGYRRPVCIEDPTIEDREEVMDIFSPGRQIPDAKYQEMDEAWYLVPEEFAEKALVLGLP